MSEKKVEMEEEKKKKTGWQHLLDFVLGRDAQKPDDVHKINQTEQEEKPEGGCGMESQDHDADFVLGQPRKKPGGDIKTPDKN
ncbi:MAG: hypothetical protein HY813_00620 [Candidatus Portnoybacteria bacterium]|nr:hypothetical protein [Candidatus Portnoybacteria bacterium]